MSRTRLLIATGNAGKLKEFMPILGEHFELVTFKDVGFDREIVEDGDSFIANARIKARIAHEVTGLAVLADDSGLEVEALGGAPGIYTARYAGVGATDLQNNTKLLQALEGQHNRKARFCCALVWIQADGTESVYEGFCEGRILTAPQGQNGFGYDPIFAPQDSELSFAQMDLSAKKAIGHRGAALKVLAQAHGF